MAQEQARSLQAQKDLETRIDGLTADIMALQEENENLERRHENVLEINNELHDEVLQLEYRLKKSDAIIQTQEKVIEDFRQAREKIEASLRDQIAAKDVVIEEMEGRLKVTFVDKILFSTGSDRINTAGRQALLKIAESLDGGPTHQIIVEGHTDNVPIGPALADRFPSNWELSAARAVAVVRFLEEKAGVDPRILSASAFSYHRPLASNDKESGRRKNRRIEIILAPINP
jgi:chemotaxis protein MotB